VTGGRDYRHTRGNHRWPNHASGFDQRREQRGRDSNIVGELLCPRPRPGVQALRRGGVGVLGYRAAGQSIAEVVGHRQHRSRACQHIAAFGVKLVNRVERQELDAGDIVDAIAADAAEHRLHRAVGSRVAVMKWLLEQVATGVEESVVHAPGVDRRAFERHGRGKLEAAADFTPQPVDVPSDGVLLADRRVGEAMDFAEVDHAIPQPPQHRATAFGTEVECKKRTVHVEAG
jgi:hypothetical protein